MNTEKESRNAIIEAIEYQLKEEELSINSTILDVANRERLHELLDDVIDTIKDKYPIKDIDELIDELADEIFEEYLTAFQNAQAKLKDYGFNPNLDSNRRRLQELVVQRITAE